MVKELIFFIFRKKPIKQNNYYVCAHCGTPVLDDVCVHCGKPVRW